MNNALGIGYHQGPVIGRYVPGDSAKAPVLVRIKITPEMAKRLPGLPNSLQNNIEHSYITIYGKLPPQLGEELFNPQIEFTSILFDQPGANVPVKMSVIAEDESVKDVADNLYAIPVTKADKLVSGNAKAKAIPYDFHPNPGDNGLPDPALGGSVSALGFLDINENMPVASFIAVGEVNKKGHKLHGKKIVTYNIVINQNDDQIAEVTSQAQTLQDLLSTLEESPLPAMQKQAKLIRSIVAGGS